MSRCDYEGVFYRVFCVSLLLIAFTFTVILTNVFVDIDNLLSKRDRESTEHIKTVDLVTDGYQTTAEIPDYYIGNERNNEIDGSYRTKRSLDSEKFFLHINSPKTKSYLTNRLAALLEALDEEPENTTPKTDNGNIYIKTVKQKNNIEINEVRPETMDNRGQKRKDEDLLHLAMHNILLQGIIGRMDMNEVYNKLQTLVTTFKYGENEKSADKAIRREEFYSETTTQGKITLNEEQNLIQELLKYKMGEPDNRDSVFEFEDNMDTGSEDELRKDKKRSRGKVKSPKYLIKTLIDIKKDENANSKENFQGVIKLIYNGKPIKIRGEDHDESKITTTTTSTTRKRNPVTQQRIQTTQTIETTTNTINKDVEEFADVLKDNYKNKHVTDSYLKTILIEYLKKFAKSNDSSATIVEKNKIRIKRNLDWSKEKQTETPQTKDDDELFVEIETHFDKKGLKGEKKRKLVSSLIQKIQNAIGSESKQQDKDSSEPRIIKRVQNPLDHGTAPSYLTNTMAPPASNLFRELNPISKSMPVLEPLPHMTDKNGDSWKQQYGPPKFLSTSKSINSAEIGLLDVDYSKETKDPVIPKRVQLPLTTDTSDETVNTVDVGKLQLLIKDIEGTGFSIGYNQYVDQEPDPESIKLFHGIEGIVNNYHEKHDKPDEPVDHDNEYEIYGQQLKKREVENSETPLRTKRFVINRHKVRRSVNQVNNYNKNEYKYIDNYRSYDAYKEVYDGREINTKEKDNNLQELMLKGEPLQIKAYRKKRSLNLRRIVNLKKKIRISKYLNTKPVPRQRMDFKMGKRNKRQIDNIKLSDKTKHASDNNIMFVVSGGDMYNDNLIVRHRQSPELFFGIVEQVKIGDENPFLKNNPFFQPSHQPRTPKTTTTKTPQLYEHKNIQTKDLMRKHENKERNKRQIHSIRIIAKDMTHKDSNEKGFSEYDEYMYPDRSTMTQLGEPLIFGVDKETLSQLEKKETGNEEVIYKNPFVAENNERVLRNNNPLVLDNHSFSLDPLVQQMNENPLMSKYPHIFVEDRTSGERPEFKHIHRTIYSRPDSKEPDMSSENEDLYKTSNVQNLVNAVVPSHRSNYKVSVKFIPHDNYNDTKPSFKEIHTTINKTFNKNGLLYSSLVNVSEISEVLELSNKTDKNTSHSCSHTKLTSAPNTAVTAKPKQRSKGIESENAMTKKQLAEYKKERNNILNIIKKEPRDTNKETAAQTSLMDIILPSNPPKVFHLTVADVGKLICNAMTSKTTEQTTTTVTPSTKASTTEKIDPKTTTLTKVTSTEVIITTTRKPEKRTTYANPQSVDPLKIKLLRAISQNEQLTSQILDRIDQNTGILQTFLTKISSEIAKLPDIASQAIMDKNRNYYPYENPRPMLSTFYTVNGSNIPPFIYALPQATPPQNVNPAVKPQTLIQASPLVKRLRINDRMADLQRNLNMSEEMKKKERTKYFLDDDLNKTVPQANELDKLAVKDGSVSDKTNTTSSKMVKELYNETTRSNLTIVVNPKMFINELAKYNIQEFILKQLRPKQSNLLPVNTKLQSLLGHKNIYEVYKLISTMRDRREDKNEIKNMASYRKSPKGTTIKELLTTLSGKAKITHEIQDDNIQESKSETGITVNQDAIPTAERKYLVKFKIDLQNNETANIGEILQDLTKLIYKRNPMRNNFEEIKTIKSTNQSTSNKDKIKMKPTVKSVQTDNLNENYKRIPIKITLHNEFNNLAAILNKFKKRNISDYLKTIVAKYLQTQKKVGGTMHTIISNLKTLKMSDSENELQTFENTNDNIKANEFTKLRLKVIGNNKKREMIIPKMKKMTTQHEPNKPQPRVKRSLVHVEKENKKETFTDILFRNWKAFLYAIRREIRNLGPILRMYPPREFLEKYWHTNLTLFQADPKAFGILASCSKLMLTQVYGIHTNYDTINPVYHRDVKPLQRRPKPKSKPKK